MKKALITGISGFVGGYLGELLASEGYEVHGTCFGDADKVLPGMPFILHEMDLTDSQNVESVLTGIRPNIVFHLAAQSSAALSWQKPALTMDINLGGTIHLLEALRRLPAVDKILLIGSSEEYGLIGTGHPVVDENYPLNPLNPYAVSKMAQNRLGTLYARAYGMPVVMTRAFNHIGPRQREAFAVPSFARQIAMIEKGLQEPVIRVGNLEAKRDFTDVRDVVGAYVLLCKKGVPGETYNIGSGTAVALSEVLNLLLGFVSSDIEIQTDAKLLRPSDTPVVVCDFQKLRKTTGWRPAYSLDKTLGDIMHYYKCDAGLRFV